MGTEVLKPRDFLVDPDRRLMTAEERGVLGLLEGFATFTRLCASRYADPCAAIEMGVPEMFRGARAMLTYAPDTLRRGAIDAAYADMMREWHVDPDTLQWTGGKDEPGPTFFAWPDREEKPKMTETVHVEFDLTVSQPVDSQRVGSWLRRNHTAISMHPVEKEPGQPGAEEDGWAYTLGAIENVTVSERAIVLDAIVALLNAEDNAGSFSCAEAEMIARFMRAYGETDDAARWLAAHARSDDDETDVHHELYLAQRVQR